MEALATDAQDHRREVGWPEILQRVATIQKAWRVKVSTPVFGVPRGGCAIAALVGVPVDRADEAELIVDDLVDSGATRAKFRRLHPNKPFAALFDKTIEPDCHEPWLVFPWETGDERVGPTDAVVRLLQHIGEDPRREGLLETPRRVVKSLREMTRGYDEKPGEILAKRFKASADEMVVVKDIPFWSLCEHHLLPFHGTVTAGYLPNGEVLGLSKIARLVHCYARRLQIQEQLTEQIAMGLHQGLDARGAACVVRARHTCMESRGVETAGWTVTSATFGSIRDDPAARAEFMALANAG